MVVVEMEKMIAMYDLEDNLITIFETTEECAKYFNTSVNVINCNISRKIRKRTPSKEWCKLFRIKEE